MLAAVSRRLSSVFKPVLGFRLIIEQFETNKPRNHFFNFQETRVGLIPTF
jgi:hypothetical protein